MTARRDLSNALDNAPAGVRRALSNALDTLVWGSGRGHPQRGVPPDPRGHTLHHEGPVKPALRRFRVHANRKEVAMAPK